MTRIECADVKDLLPELIRGELEEGDRAVVTEHVSSCVSCSEEAEFLERILGAAFSPRASLASEIKSAVAAAPSTAERHASYVGGSLRRRPWF